MRVRRLPWHDSLRDGDQLAVFAGDQVVVLSPLGSAILEIVRDEWVHSLAISRRLTLLFGAPSGATDPLGASELALEALVEQGLIEIAHPDLP